MTETETTIETPVEEKKELIKDLQMKYFAESFEVKPDIEWKGEYKKDFVSDYSLLQEYHSEDTIATGDCEKIHNMLMENNETYSTYFKEVNKRTALTFATNLDYAHYLDLLIKYKILIVNLNETGKLIKETRDSIRMKLNSELEKYIKSNQHEIEEQLGYLNGNETRYGYSLGEISENDVTKSDFDMSHNIEKRYTTFNKILKMEGSKKSYESCQYLVDRIIDDEFF